MSYDPTIEPTILQEIDFTVARILKNIGVPFTEKLGKDLVDFVYSVNRQGDRPEYVPTEEVVLHLIVERLLTIGSFTTEQDVLEMAEHYNNIGEK